MTTTDPRTTQNSADPSEVQSEDAHEGSATRHADTHATTVIKAAIGFVELAAGHISMGNNPKFAMEQLARAMTALQEVNAIHSGYTNTNTANRLKKTARWEEYPKLASIFQHRPAENVYWNELVRFLDEYGGERG